MAILYNFKKEKDNFLLEVEQKTIQTLYYLSSNTQVKISTTNLLANTLNTISTGADGKYKILLEVENETSIEIFFTVFKQLQNSIIEDTQKILCCKEECKDCSEKLIDNKECFKKQKSLIKNLSFETLFIDSYGVDFPLIFTNFLNESIQTISCKIQTKINTILNEELIRGKVNEDKIYTISELYIALYWAGMYFIEENIAGNNEEQLEFVKTKFKYNTISQCLCDYCFDIDSLKEIFEGTNLNTYFYSFQFDGTAYNIDNINILSSEYLQENGNLENIETLLGGKNISFTNVGRIGFVIKNTLVNQYRIYDNFNVDITDVTFDTFYNSTTKTEYFVSKSYYTPSTIYFKFVKI